MLKLMVPGFRGLNGCQAMNSSEHKLEYALSGFLSTKQ
jgi:hypothetical protein